MAMVIVAPAVKVTVALGAKVTVDRVVKENVDRVVKVVAGKTVLDEAPWMLMAIADLVVRAIAARVEEAIVDPAARESMDTDRDKVPEDHRATAIRKVIVDRADLLKSAKCCRRSYKITWA
ncbi:hypothetical protein [Rhodopirellula islandica]|uniref:hypothetical protein n=1 Tax=Rhodopirellula islandica TaxID=595434 RepID=UPI001F37AB86|nr:hypothetical protein [Rhodopirellula islandica]